VDLYDYQFVQISYHHKILQNPFSAVAVWSMLVVDWLTVCKFLPALIAMYISFLVGLLWFSRSCFFAKSPQHLHNTHGGYVHALDIYNYVMVLAEKLLSD
jgi:hypothetical protein